ncbi:MAG: response regulator [Bacteroidia bacterium]
MKKKLNCILLIDDNPDDNFYHKRVIKKTNCCNNIVAIESALEALDFIKAKPEHPETHPDLIFLDINMPGMNGWEFLEEYNKLEINLQSRVVVVMLTTSQNPDDRNKAKALNIISEFETKPLENESLERILKQLFADYF